MANEQISPRDGHLEPPAHVAVIGAGAFGRFCIDAYRQAPDIQVSAAVDPDAAALSLVDLPESARFQDWREAISRPEIEAMHVATPPHLRREIMMAAFEAGKSVFCEKPLGLSLAEVDVLIASSERHGVALGVDYVMRYQPAYEILEAVSSSGIMGAIRTISFLNLAQRVPADHWFWDRSKSGGILVEHGVHFFDAYARIAGVARQVSAKPPRPEAIEATVWYQSGAVGRFFHEFAYRREAERTVGTTAFELGYVEIEGWIPERVSGLMVGDTSELRAAFRRLTFPITIGPLGTAVHFEAFFPDRQQHYQSAIVDGMRDLLRRHRNPSWPMRVTCEDARRSLETALAATKAADEGHPAEIS